jgi:Tfp pilus assembly protein PilZ
MPCELNADGKRYSGLVVDVSSGGLFVQTRANLAPGTPVALTLRDGRHELPLQAAVARKRVVPARLACVTHGGVGLRVVGTPESYARILDRLA